MSLTPKGKGRQKFLSLAPISSQATPNQIVREEWLDQVAQKFISPSQANRAYYRVLLETLWPPGHGIPGPHIKQDQLRDAIDQFRQGQHQGHTPYKPYVDVFRRLRELQGEEGIKGIGREGQTFQLVSLEVGPKRIPRIKLTDADWTAVLEQYSHQCAVCQRQEPEIRLQQDHKVPRVRGGGNQLDNWQPLCDECNNFKSTACRGCYLACETCCWAFPDRYAPIQLSAVNIQRIRQLSRIQRNSPVLILNQIVDDYFQRRPIDG